MKKAFIFIFLFIVCDISAQWSVGGKVGANWSKMAKLPWETGDSKQKIGLSLGTIGTYNLNNWFELQGELLYSQRGFKETLADPATDNYDVNIRHQYIDIPILVKFYPFQKKECFNILTGIQTGFLLKESLKSDGSTIKDIYGKKNPVDFGLIFGLAYNFEKGLFFDARYILGLTDNYKKFEGIKSRSIQLSVGYLFQL